MQDRTETMVRGRLAEAFREIAAILDGCALGNHGAWPTMNVPADGGHGRADVYLAGCSALSGLARRLQVPIFKIGATRQPLLTRQSDLCADRYAAAVRRDGYVIAEPGFDDWEMRRLDPIALPGPGIELVPRALRVDLTMPFGEFETALRRTLLPHALTTWAGSTTGRDRLKAVCADASIAHRFTCYGFGDQVRSSPCNELYVIRPRVDMPRICEAVARALAARQSHSGRRSSAE